MTEFLHRCLLPVIKLTSLSLLLMAAMGGAADAQSKKQKRTDSLTRVGFVEYVQIGDKSVNMKAKMDTGAASTSVHAEDVELYQKPGTKTHARFTITGQGGYKKRYDLNVTRFTLIKKKGGGHIRRPVVKMPICVGNRLAIAEVNLADRDNFIYPLLVGREFMEDRLMVDSGDTFVEKPRCEWPSDD